MRYQIRVGSRQFDVEILDVHGSSARVNVNGVPHEVQILSSGHPGTGHSHVRPPALRHDTGASHTTLPSTVPPAATPAASPPTATAPAKQSPAASTKPAAPKAAAGGALTAPIPGLIVNVLVKEGDVVKAGQQVIIMEAMKMENNIAAHVSGTVKEIPVQKGSEVRAGEVLMVIA